MKPIESIDSMSFIRSSLLVDVTMFANHPTKTGIQRMLKAFIEQREVFRLVPFIITSDGRVGLLSMEYFDHCLQYFSQGPGVLRDLSKHFHGSATDKDEHYVNLKSAAKPILVLEADIAFAAAGAILHWDYNFYQHTQQVYLDRIGRFGEKIFFVVIDFLFWTQHEHFLSQAEERPEHTRYLILLRRARNLLFISKETREEFLRRVGKKWQGRELVALPGGDALGCAQRNSVPTRAQFVVVGTIEPRKHSIEILGVFENLIRNHSEISLTFLGNLSPLLSDIDRARFERLRDSPGPIQWIDSPADAIIKKTLSGARALICISSGEGYGAPPVEALSLGVPCITSDNLPSIKAIGTKGQLVICHDDWKALAGAILRFKSTKFAHAKQKEIEELVLPAWAGFASSFFAWTLGAEQSGALDDFYQSYARFEFGELSGNFKIGVMSSTRTESLLRIKEAIRCKIENLFITPQGALPVQLASLEKPAVIQETFSIQEIEFAIKLRFRWHCELLKTSIQEFSNKLGQHYLGRSLSWEERKIFNLIPGSVCQVISVIRAFAECDERKLFFTDPMSDQWIAFLTQWENYQIVLPICQHNMNLEFLDQCYRSLLQRNPDSEGADNYLRLLVESPTNGRKQVLSSILTSSEHLERIANYPLFTWALHQLDISVIDQT